MSTASSWTAIAGFQPVEGAPLSYPPQSVDFKLKCKELDLNQSTTLKISVRLFSAATKWLRLLSCSLNDLFLLPPGSLRWSEDSGWMAEDWRRGRSPSWRASQAADHGSGLHPEGSERCTFLGLVQEAVWWTWALLSSLLCAQPVPADFHKRQREESDPPRASCSRAGGPPRPLWHSTVPGGEGAGGLHGDRDWKGSRATGAASSLCCRCHCASRGRHAPVT